MPKDPCKLTNISAYVDIRNAYPHETAYEEATWPALLRIYLCCKSGDKGQKVCFSLLGGCTHVVNKWQIGLSGGEISVCNPLLIMVVVL